jgi:hypothetical protein
VKPLLIGGLVALSTTVFAGTFVVAAADAKVGCESLAHRLPRVHARLPAPVGVTTPCGHFVLSENGTVARSRPTPRPVPAGASWYPADLTWYRVVRGHVVIGVRRRLLWRSRRPLATRFDVSAVVRGHDTVAFSLFYGAASELFVARLDGREHFVGRGETPIGWTRSGDLVVARLRAGNRPESLVLLAPSGRLLRPVAVDAEDWAWAEEPRVLYLLVHRRVERFDGGSVVRFASLDSIGIGGTPRLTALGHVLVVSDNQGIAVLEARTGAVVATASFRRPKTQQWYGSIAVNANGTAVAFTWNNLPAASSDPSIKHVVDTVYLLRSHAQSVSVLQRVPITYPNCDETSSLVWRGRSLVYTETGGHAVIFRPLTSSPPLELTPLVTKLSGDYVAEPISFTVK